MNMAIMYCGFDKSKKGHDKPQKGFDESNPYRDGDAIPTQSLRAAWKKYHTPRD
jgi:hypothetical protein